MKGSLIRVFKLIFKQTIEPLKVYPWGSILNILLTSLQLYCLNFILILSFIFVFPIITNFENILENTYILLHAYFIVGYEYHLWFFGLCLLFSISNEL